MVGFCYLLLSKDCNEHSLFLDEHISIERGNFLLVVVSNLSSFLPWGMPLKGHQSDKLNMQGDPPFSVPNRIKKLFRLVGFWRSEGCHNFHWHPGRWNYPPLKLYPPWIYILTSEFIYCTLPETQWRVSHWKTVLGRSLSFRFWLSWFSTFYHIIILHLQLTCIKRTISPRTKTKTTCYVCMPCLIHVFPQKI